MPPDRYFSIRDDYLFLAGSHSSELTSLMCREVEDQFKKGQVNFLLATPTLEMGIDIGDLRHVMMIGVPPMPSNYAQRAGRAGRRGKSSLVVCYCSHDKAHDRHYFQNPKAMINGLITPPSLHEPTLEIAKKHARATILADYVDNGRTMREFLDTYDQIIAQRMPNISHMFDSHTEKLQTYFSCTFRQECEEQLEAALASNVSPSQYFYNEAYLPDYGFHHDSVQVWEKETYDETLNAKGAISPMETDYISEREQELAYTKFAPGRVAFLAGNVYRFRSEGEWTEWHLSSNGKPEDSSPPVRSCSRILVDQEVGRARKDATPPLYDRSVFFSTRVKPEKMEGILDVRSADDCVITFINRGDKSDGPAEPFMDSSSSRFYMGYRITRQALILSFNRSVFSNLAGPLSCVSAVDRAIKDVYRLDESELRLIPYITNQEAGRKDEEQDKYVHFLFYDASGNGDLPLESARQHFNHLLAEASAKLHGCPHCEQAEMDGCYYCLKSFYTQFVAPYAKRSDALNIIDYLLGKAAFVPSIQQFTGDITSPDRILVIRVVGNEVRAHQLDSDDVMTCEGKDADSVYRLAADAVREFYPKGTGSLLIRSNIEYLVNNLNGRNRINQARYAFATLKYELLRFDSVRVEKL